MSTISRRLNVLVCDTETTNTMDDPIIYNVGFAVMNPYTGEVMTEHSYIISDVYYGMSDLMKTAYYAEKLPKYEQDIADGTIEVVTFAQMKRIMAQVCKEYGVKAFCAHNASFDYRALNASQRYLTKSRYRYFFPKGLEIWDSQKMAHDTICKQKAYRKFCEENGYMTKHPVPRPQEKAEVLFRYITKDNDFVEEHRAIEDVRIEMDIIRKCFAQHKKMRRTAFEG